MNEEESRIYEQSIARLKGIGKTLNTKCAWVDVRIVKEYNDSLGKIEQTTKNKLEDFRISDDWIDEGETCEKSLFLSKYQGLCAYLRIE